MGSPVYRFRCRSAADAYLRSQIGAAVTIVVFAALAAGLYAAGLVRFGKRMNVLLDSASGLSATSSEFPIKGSQVQVRFLPVQSEPCVNRA